MSENKTEKDTMVKDALILCAITLILGLILAGVYTVTKKPIEDAQAKTNNEACQQVVSPGALVGDDDQKAVETTNQYFAGHDLANKEVSQGESLADYVEVTQVHPVTDAGGNKVGQVYLANAKKGYGGKIGFALGVDQNGAVTGLSITSQNETAGLGANCEDPDWQASFGGKVLPEDPSQNMYNKNEETKSQIQALSGATVTSRALTHAVKGILFASEGGGQ